MARDMPDAPVAAGESGPVSMLADGAALAGGQRRIGRDASRHAAGVRITEAFYRLDDVVREVRKHAFAERVQGAQPRCRPQVLAGHARGLAQIANRVASLNEYVVQTARALQSAAADTATLLEQRADLIGQPGQVDYPAEIKRRRAFADQAEQMVKHWEQRR